QERFRSDPVKTSAAASPYQTPLKVAEPSTLPAAMEKLQKRGLVRLDCSEPDAKAWYRSRSVEKIRCSGEGERNKDFGNLLPSTVSVDFDSQQAIEPEAGELRSFSGIQALLNGDEFRYRMNFGNDR